MTLLMGGVCDPISILREGTCDAYLEGTSWGLLTQAYVDQDSITRTANLPDSMCL